VASFTTQVHVTGSARRLDQDLPFFQAIVDAVYDSHAVVFHNWLDAASTRNVKDLNDDADWETILSDSLEAIKKTDLVIVEASQLSFSQGLQTYTAAQYKKPTLVVSRTPIADRFISGIGNKFITIKQYSDEADLKTIVKKFIKENVILEKDLRFNMVLDRPIYKYLRDTSYETGKNKSQIVRTLLENDIEKRNS
jgi:hypothetical protein